MVMGRKKSIEDILDYLAYKIDMMKTCKREVDLIYYDDEIQKTQNELNDALYELEIEIKSSIRSVKGI